MLLDSKTSLHFVANLIIDPPGNVLRSPGGPQTPLWPTDAIANQISSIIFALLNYFTIWLDWLDLLWLDLSRHVCFTFPELGESTNVLPTTSKSFFDRWRAPEIPWMWPKTLGLVDYTFKQLHSATLLLKAHPSVRHSFTCAISKPIGFSQWHGNVNNWLAQWTE